MRKKVTIIGAGNVGASAAQLVAHGGIADVVLFDIAEGIPQGKALDIAEACPLWNSAVSVKGTNSYDDTSQSDVIVITAGFPRKPGMSRDDLLSANAGVVRGVAKETARHSPDAVMIVVTNPMDVMAQLAWKVSGFPHRRVLGMGGVLDSARFRTFVALEVGVSPADVEALVMGGHGDQMVPMPRFTTVKGVPITKTLSAERITSLIERTRNGGAEIVALLKTGSAYYAPAAATCQMIEAILFDERRILPSAAYLEGKYGVSGLFVGVPAIIGSGGVEEVIELELDEVERASFDKSVSALKALVDKIV
ncbi:MAG TPA: malate dehydrogenase [Thermodesulfovibrionales bacterium]|nr:malate dehydrogenase [Thermodesulfovibrionales bacterium]